MPIVDVDSIKFPDSNNFTLEYDGLQPHQKKFWDTVETILTMGITPTPRVVNEALGKNPRTSWNGPLCQIRIQLLKQYGYELVNIGTQQWRWKKVTDNASN